ncbi:MAG: Spy/CpxP family protein refolding chaperone [Bacteroidota bacterium]
MKKTLFGALAVIMMAALTMAAAQPDPDPRPMPGRHNPEAMMFERLNLTDQQKSDVRKLHADMERAAVKTQASIRLARIDLRQLLGADKLDRTAIEKKVKEISGLQQEVKSALIDHLFAVYALLTPEQQKIFKEHMAQKLDDGMMGPRMGQRMRGGAKGPGMGPGHGMGQGPGMGMGNRP